jgi:hypothetical protein
MTVVICCTGLAESGIMPAIKYWDITAGKLSAVSLSGWRWMVDAHRDEDRPYIVESDELLSAFLELKATLL